MNWHDFELRATVLAKAGRDRFERSNLALIGTLGHDGWPRISPVEPLFIGDDLVLGMIWKSRKAQDLLRNPRCVLHSVVTDPDANEGEFKVWGMAASATEEAQAHIREKWRLPPEHPLHAFRVDIRRVSLISYELGEGLMIVRKWTPSDGETETGRTYP